MTLQYQGWPSGIRASGGQVHFDDRSLPTPLAEEESLRAYWGGCVRRMFDLLPAGPVRVMGAEGIEDWVGHVAEVARRTVSADAINVLDIGAVLLDLPGRFGEMDDEAVIVIAIHPARARQSFDFYSTIHRHSLTVKLAAWELGEPLQELGDIGDARPLSSAWIMTPD